MAVYQWELEAKKIVSLRDNLITNTGLLEQDPNSLDPAQKSLQMALRRYLLEEQLQDRSAKVRKFVKAKNMGKWNLIPENERHVLDLPATLHQALQPNHRIGLHPNSVVPQQLVPPPRTRPPPPASATMSLPYEEPETVAGRVVPNAPAKDLHMQKLKRSRPEEDVIFRDNVRRDNRTHQYPPGMADYVSPRSQPPPPGAFNNTLNGDNRASDCSEIRQSERSSSSDSINESEVVRKMTQSSESQPQSHIKGNRDKSKHQAKPHDGPPLPQSFPMYSDSSPNVPEMVESLPLQPESLPQPALRSPYGGLVPAYYDSRIHYDPYMESSYGSPHGSSPVAYRGRHYSPRKPRSPAQRPYTGPTQQYGPHSYGDDF